MEHSPRGSRRPARERVLDSALELFGSKGFAATTTRDIAARAGVNEVTLFRNFGSKQGLFAAVFAERSLVPAVTGSVEFDTETPLDEMLLRNVETVLGILKANRHIFMVMLGDSWRQPKARRNLGDVPLQMAIDFLASMLEGQMDAGRLRRMEPEVAARALIGMVQAYFLTTYLLQGSPDDPGRDRAFASGFVSIFLDGLRPDEEGGGP
jgi:AcrR family transcriptional regulator